MNADKIYAESLVNEYTPKLTAKDAELAEKRDAFKGRPSMTETATAGRGKATRPLSAKWRAPRP